MVGSPSYSMTSFSGDTLSRKSLQAEDRVYCEVATTDGNESGPWVSSTA